MLNWKTVLTIPEARASTAMTLLFQNYICIIPLNYYKIICSLRWIVWQYTCSRCTLIFLYHLITNMILPLHFQKGRWVNSLAPVRCIGTVISVPSNTWDRLSSWALLTKLLSCECYRPSLMISQHIFNEYIHKPLLEPMLTHIYIAIWYHQDTLS